MIKIREAVIVEGKYDKIRLSNFIDGLIITTEGFGIFKNKEKQALIRHLAEKRGILILTDSDGAGFVIRNFLKGTVPRDKLYHAYIPDIAGKERRKAVPSKEGKIGVEGISDEILMKAIAASGAHCSITDETIKKEKDITKADLYIYGLTGGVDSGKRRNELKEYLKLPENMTCNSLVDVLNCIMTKEEFEQICKKLYNNGQEEINA